MKEVTPEEWVTALESGDYVCGRGFLRYDPSIGDHPDPTAPPEIRYCCLGVLLELMGVSDPEQLHIVSEWVDEDAVPHPEWLDPEVASRFAILNDMSCEFPIAEIKEVYGLD